MITHEITSSTYVICTECGNTVFARDPDNVVDMNENYIWLRCHNQSCGHAGRYSATDLIDSADSRIIDHTNRLFLAR